MEKFWRWLFEFSKKKIQEYYINRVYSDTMCSNCKTWTSEMNGVEKVEELELGDTILTCKRCKHEKKWNLDCPVPIERE